MEAALCQAVGALELLLLIKKKYSLKLDLYFSRFEQEKENSFKELQKQSIEYEKKLQDQLEERNQELDNLRASHKRAKTERKAFEKARSALEVGFSNLYFYGKCHKILPFLWNFYQFLFAFLWSNSRQQSQKHSRKYKIKIFFLKAQLAEVTLLVSQKEQERINLDEKREMLETILNDKDKTFRAMEGEIASLKAQLEAQVIIRTLLPPPPSNI